MKKLLFLCLLLIIGCTPGKLEYDAQNGLLKDSALGGYYVQEFEYDGCTYVAFSSGVGDSRVFSVAHKGNCPNCNK